MMTTPFAFTVTPAELKAWQGDNAELAVLDVREAGEFAAGHISFSSSAPLSLFEFELGRLVPRRSCRLVLVSGGSDRRADFAAVRARELGYGAVGVLQGGVEAWAAGGYQLFEGQFVLSKAFGELVEAAFSVPHVSAAELKTWLDGKRPVLLLDGRPMVEHLKMNIPGSICLPNGELAYRAASLVPDQETAIVVHCAGRTRSILGAQILREIGAGNPVYALENGTQGWALAGFDLERGSVRTAESAGPSLPKEETRAQAARFAERWSVPFISPEVLGGWIREPERTTYVLDVRSSAEFEREHISGASHAPGGQLLQATDTWLATHRARVVLVDDVEVRAVVVARWLRLMGWEAYALGGGELAWRSLDVSGEEVGSALPPLLTLPNPSRLPRVFDLRSSSAYRAAHIAEAEWALRPHLLSISKGADLPPELALCSGDEREVALAAGDLTRAGVSRVTWLGGDLQAWAGAGYRIEATPDRPAPEEAIDFVAFTHDRHSGNLEAARQYLAWETGLLSRLDESDRSMFRL